MVSRADGAALTPADLEAADQARQRMLAVASEAGPPTRSPKTDSCGRAVPLQADLSGFALNDKVKALRAAAADGLPGDLRVEVTGGPAFGADIADSFSGANITLLSVTAAVVALLLIAHLPLPGAVAGAARW